MIKKMWCSCGVPSTLIGTVVALAVAVGVGAGEADGADDDVPLGDADAFTPGEAEDVGTMLAPGSGAFPTVAPPLHAASTSAKKMTDELRFNMKIPLRRTGK
jgi:hypothetical protein